MRAVVVAVAVLAIAATACSSGGTIAAPGPEATRSSTTATTAARAVSATPPTTAPVSGMAVAWRTTIGEPVLSRLFDEHVLTVQQGVVLVATERSLLAFDATSGALRWSSPLVAHTPTGRLTAIVEDSVVFTPDSHGIARVDLRTGARRWRADLGEPSDCRAVGSPAANERHVFVTVFDRCGTNPAQQPPGRLHAFALADGAKAWDATLPGTEGGDAHARPAATAQLVVVGTISDRRASAKDTYVAFDAVTGAMRWSKSFERVPATVALGINEPPRMVGDVVIVQHASVVTDIGRPAGLDARTGSVLWQANIGNEVLVGDTLLATDLVRSAEADPLATIAVDVRNGLTRWRDPTLHGSLRPSRPGDPAVIVSDRFVVLNVATGSRVVDVILPPPEGRLVRRVGVTVEGVGVVIGTSPTSNVTTASTDIDLLDLGRGTRIATLREPKVATAIDTTADSLLVLYASTTGLPSEIVSYRLLP